VTRRLLILVLCVVCSCTPAAPPRTPASQPQRIISVVPSATETLFALGLSDRVIAVGDYDPVPPEVGSKPRIGGLLNPNIEKIIEYRPDLVITYGTQEVLQDRLKTIGIRLYPFTHGGVDHTLEFILDLGKTVGAEDKAREIAARIRKEFQNIRAHEPASRPKVLLVHNRAAGVLGSFYSIGSRAFQHELIQIAGGEDIFADVDKEVLQPTVEEVIARMPDIIIETLAPPLDAKEAAQRTADWAAFRSVPAVRNHRVYVVAEEFLLLPGPRLDEAARYFAEIIRK
jgi:cobalamin transport system substrate-binding protein